MGRAITIPEEGLDYLLYKDNSQTLSNYIMQQMNQLPTMFTEVGQRIYQSLNNALDFVNNKIFKLGIMDKLYKENILVDNNYIQELLSFEALQQANLTMQRWIMSHPVVRQYYLENNIDGYSETYQNAFGNQIGEDDYNYRRVMDGIVQDDPNEDRWFVKHYDEPLYPNDRELENYDKFRILNTWSAIDYILETCNFDFTNPNEVQMIVK